MTSQASECSLDSVWNSEDEESDEFASTLEEIEALAAGYARGDGARTPSRPGSALNSLKSCGSTSQSEGNTPKQMRVIREIVETEDSYVRSLGIVLELYIKPLRSNPEQAGLPNDQQAIQLLFSSIETLAQLNGRFLSELQECLQDGKGAWCCRQIALAFSRFAPYFKMYSQYVCNHNAANQFLQRLKDNSKFRAFCKQAEIDPRSKSLPLQSFLIMPIQRVPRYRLLLQELIKASPGDPALPSLEASLELVRRVADKINQDAKMHEERQALAALEAKFFSHPGFTAPGRHLIRYGEVTRHAKNTDIVCELFLFNNLLAYASTLPLTNKYMLERKVPIDRFFTVELVSSPAANTNTPPATQISSSSCSSSSSSSSSLPSSSSAAATSTTTTTATPESASQPVGSLPAANQHLAVPQPANSSPSDTSSSTLSSSASLSISGSPEKPKTQSQRSLPEGAFAVRSPSAAFVVFARTPQETASWYADILSCCQRQREPVKEKLVQSIAQNRLSLRKAGPASPTGSAYEVFRQPLWEEDFASATCRCCQTPFSFTTRRHHCRVCGRLVCSACSKNRTTVAGSDTVEPQRTCNFCVRRISNAGLGPVIGPGSQSASSSSSSSSAASASAVASSSSSSSSAASAAAASANNLSISDSIINDAQSPKTKLARIISLHSRRVSTGAITTSNGNSGINANISSLQAAATGNPAYASVSAPPSARSQKQSSLSLSMAPVALELQLRELALAVKKQDEIIRKQEEVMKRQEEAGKRQEELLKKQDERLSKLEALVKLLGNEVLRHQGKQ